jgi:hypothetical protein
MPTDATRCAACGAHPLDETELDPHAAAAAAAAGRAGAGSGARTEPAPGRGTLDKSALSRATFTSGQVLAGRYRLLTRLGEGGMGQVWRAEDQELGEEVAVKMLSPALATNRRAIEQLRQEVQLARRITHPNVCRVHDIGQHAGQPFLTMEYVDGESLAASLKRIGRFPSDKVVDIAMQLCAGLQAAHALGILHRDLKPANVMLDSTGRVRITDFGIAHIAKAADAASTDGLSRRDRAAAQSPGSPGYMAPELFTGDDATIASDIYSLGLILWELHTGRPYFQALTMTDLLRQHREDPKLLGDQAPSVERHTERAVMACLERDPHLRPKSALAVRAMLAGSDAIAIALASGETPSVDEIAAAGGPGTLRRAHALVLVAISAVTVALALLVLGPRVSIAGKVDLPDGPTVLAARARALVKGPDRSLGIPDIGLQDGVGGVYDAFGFDVFENLIGAIDKRDRSDDRWQRLRDDRLSGVDFWYRQSPRPLIAAGDSRHVVSWSIPSHDEPGMVAVRLDPRGRLRELLVVPLELLRTPRTPVRAQPPEPDWQGLFDAAGLGPIAAFRETPPARVPAVFADTRRAWLGHYPEHPDRAIRVAAASLGGTTVAFRVLDEDWSDTMVFEPPSAYGKELTRHLGVRELFLTFLTIVAGLLAAWTLRQGRGDVRGALRLGAVTFAVTSTATLLVGNARLVHLFAAELDTFENAVTRGLSLAGQFTLFYLAAEPLVRRVLPHAMIGWTRLLRGHFRDPLVSRDILLGTAGGGIVACLFLARLAIPGWIGRPPEEPWVSPLFGVESLTGMRESIGCGMETLVYAARFAVGYLLLLVGVQWLLRKNVLAIGFYLVCLLVTDLAGTPITPLTVVFSMLQVIVAAFLLLRFGALSLGVAAAVLLLLVHVPWTSGDLGAWSSGSVWLAATLTAVPIVFGFMHYRPRADPLALQ